MSDCPSSVRKGAIYEAKANLEACFTNLKNKNIKSFTTPYRTKKNEQLRGWSFSLEKNNIFKEKDSLSIFPTMLDNMRYYSTKQLHKLIPKNKPEMDCKIQKNKYGEYFLIIPYVCERLKPPSKEIFNPVACDTGVRKFITTYAPNNKESFMIGNRFSTTLMNELVQLDSMISKYNKEKNKELKKQIIKKRKKIDNLKSELHFQVSNFLSKRYDMVMIPKLESNSLCLKATRRLKTKTVRALLNAGHCRFFDTLKDKCWQNGCKFLHVREEYTSQTCPCCGSLNKCQEVYHCKHCDFKHDRDIVGALNIMLKSVREYNPEV